jgi:hypothetical protein
MNDMTKKYRTTVAVLTGLLIGCSSSPATNTGSADTANADTAKDVSTLCPPSNRPQATQEAAAGGESMCLTVFEKKAFDLLATATPVGTGELCSGEWPSDLCFVKLILSAPRNGGVFGVAYDWYQYGAPPQRFEFDSCNDTSGVCEFEGYIGLAPVKVIYDVDAKTFDITDSSTLIPYKLIEE